MLIRSGELTPPIVNGQVREAWSHKRTPNLLKTHLKKMIPHNRQRNEFASRLGDLYKVRIDADYISSETATANQAESARMSAGMILKGAQHALEG